MTPEEFSKLTPPEQEDYINSGGEISSSNSEVLGSSDTEVCCDSSVKDVETQVGCLQAESVVLSPSVSPIDYEGIETTQPAAISPESPPAEDWSEGFDIKTPVHLLYILDEDIASGKVALHDWQIQFMMDFAREDWSKDKPFKAAVKAANGSGKDKFILAACIVWLCMRYKQALGVATNGSGAQLDNQTEYHIDYLCKRANLKWAGGKELIWKCTYRYYECIPTQSPIFLFATDEPNKAEGYHALKAGGKMAIFASEAKAIPDSIFAALTRCKGFTHRIDVSSPGLPVGYFYDRCMTAVNRKSIENIEIISTGTTVLYHITAFDCSHISKAEIEDFADSLPAGVNDPVYISGVLAEFTTTDEMVVIPFAFTQWTFHVAKEQLKWEQEEHNKAGLDLSDGGAETVLVVRNGNRHLKTIPFRFQDTEDTLNFLEEKFAENELTHKEAYIFTDICGMGKPMANSLRRRGWSNVRYVDSRNKSSDPKIYFNRGTELFFNVRLLMQRHQIIGEYDKMLISQLAGRYYKLRGGTVRQLLSKLEQKAKGYPSPDRADAFNLAFWDFKSISVHKEYSKSAPSDPIEQQEEQKPVGVFSLKTWAGNNGSSLESFRRNVSKRQPITRLQKELERYNLVSK